MIRLPRWGCVRSVGGPLSWLVIDDAGAPIEPIRVFLQDFAARGNRPASIRSYAYVLLRWWRWLSAVGVEWNRAAPTEVRDLVLWLQIHPKYGPGPVAVGSVNALTGKPVLGSAYAVRTIRHNNAVLASFYDFWVETAGTLMVNPVTRRPSSGSRANAHHNPMRPYRPEGGYRYNPKLPRRLPRAMNDEQWAAVFGQLRSNRDRALLALAVSCGARAGELLGIRECDVNWGEHLVMVRRKGSGAEQWLPASTEAFVWLRLYWSERSKLPAENSIWENLRGDARSDGLSYDALRAVMRRVNAALGTNWTMHDLRHTCALRMAHDDRLSLRDVQTILGHAQLSTTVGVYLVEDNAAILDRVARHLAERSSRPPDPPAAPAVGYDAADLSILFGRDAPSW